MPKETPHEASSPPPGSEEEALMQAIRAAIRSVKHGYVQIIIQDSRVVQIDKTEKIRLA